MSIRVLLVDDSAVMRQTLGALLQAMPGIELLASVADPILARKRMQQQWPDAIVLPRKSRALPSVPTPPPCLRPVPAPQVRQRVPAPIGSLMSLSLSASKPRNRA